jgi:hypothetical protein
METVELKNGSTENLVVVLGIMLTLKGVKSKGIEGVLILYDLYEICKNPSYQPEIESLQSLQNLKLLREDGELHTTVKNVVLSAIQVQEGDLLMGSPYE